MNPKPGLIDIVGVVGDVRDLGMDLEAQPTIYSVSVSPQMTILVRSSTDSKALAEPVRRIIRETDAEAPISLARSLDDVVRASLGRQRLAVMIFLGFAALAVALVAVGVYGVVSYSVGRRTREFGVRMALGAGSGRVFGMVLNELLVVAGKGFAGGIALAFAFAHLMQSLLFGLTPGDPLSFVFAAVVVALAAGIGAALPARRAARLDPASALRNE